MKRNGYAIAIKALDSLIGNRNEFYTATNKFNHIFICECIDIFESIDNQIKLIKKHLSKYNIIGIKI